MSWTRVMRSTADGMVIEFINAGQLKVISEAKRER